MPLAPESFLYELDAATGVATLTLNRPERLNALTFEVYRELREAFLALDDEPGVRAILLTGAGRAFCSGGDVESIIGALFERDYQGLLDFTRDTGALILSMIRCRRPIVGVLNGTVAGAGAVIAAACDVRIAAEEAKIAYLFTKVGLSGADMGASWLLPRLVGLGRAAEILMTGEFLDAREAHRIGLYNRVVPAGDLMAEGRRWAEKLAAGPSFGLEITKQMLYREAAMDVEAAMANEVEIQAACMQHPDFREAYEAFVGKAPAEVPLMLDLATIRPLLEDRHLRLAEQAAAHVRLHIAPLQTVQDDAEGRLQAREVLRILGETGLARFTVPRAWGGAGDDMDVRACCLVRELLGHTSPLADAVFALQALGSRPLQLAGAPENQQRWLPEVAAGRAMAAFAMTEPEAGSDVASLATRARRAGDEYVLDGRKSFISNAGIADFYSVFASTEPKAGRRGLSCFLIPAGTPGLRFVGPQVMSAPHPLGEIAFERCRVPVSARLGEEGDGFMLGMRTLDRLRPSVAAAACGMASRALEEALAHARERSQFGKPLVEFQLVQEKLARMATELAAARLLTYRAAWEADLGAERVTLRSAMAKSFATEAAQRVVDDAVQILGGRGVLAAHPVDHLYRSVRALRIYEGTTEIQHLVIARQLLQSV